MTIENKTEQTTITVGKLLVQARERMGLSQEVVAERLCLKVSTVKQIEEDIAPAGVEPTFLRGYIRLYARMVAVPENEIKSLLKIGEPAEFSNVSPMQSYSLGKKRKKREGWLMILTWLIVVVIVAMIGVWWWQDHNAQKNELVTMASQNDLILSQQDNSTSPIELSDPAPDITIAVDDPINENTAETRNQDQLLDIQPTDSPVKTIPLPNMQPSVTPVDRTQSNPNEAVEAVPTSTSALVLNFTGSCWLEIRDANNKVLFSGTKSGGETLELNGAEPYRLNIGAPANVNVQFKGDTVDLNRFIKQNRPAKLLLPAAPAA